MPVDGTTEIMECSIHGFTTRDQTKWYQHLESPGHFEVGSGVCYICGNPISFTLKDNITLVSRDGSGHMILGRWTHKECR